MKIREELRCEILISAGKSGTISAKKIISMKLNQIIVLRAIKVTQQFSTWREFVNRMRPLDLAYEQRDLAAPGLSGHF